VLHRVEEAQIMETVTKAHARQSIKDFEKQLERRLTQEAWKGKFVCTDGECLCGDELGSAVIEPRAFL
jgi:hypothetical protein